MYHHCHDQAHTQYPYLGGGCARGSNATHHQRFFFPLHDAKKECHACHNLVHPPLLWVCENKRWEPSVRGVCVQCAAILMIEDKDVCVCVCVCTVKCTSVWVRMCLRACVCLRVCACALVRDCNHRPHRSNLHTRSQLAHCITFVSHQSAPPLPPPLPSILPLTSVFSAKKTIASFVLLS